MNQKHALALACCFLLAGSPGLGWPSAPARQEESGISPTRSQKEPRYTNRLIREKSPYLLLHAHNPVDWFPWGEEAFEKARREQKPIFLSVGYYTCHWCHVMERESFSDPDIAAILNRDFVSIKVDREERPDIDRLYMAYVETLTGSGGWPMTVFLTPDRKPFFGGTYFPEKDTGGEPGLRTILLRIAKAWQSDRASILRDANQATQQLQSLFSAPVSAAGSLKPAVLDKTFEQIRASYDPVHGGFGGAPKFPRPVVFNFLFRYYARTGQKQALDMALASLRAMARGGIHDQLGGGFHRYSTDTAWRLPHFEKMLYDQAELAIASTEAYQITHERFFAGLAHNVLDFSLREMRGAEGGFFSALDADSPVEAGKARPAEGADYIWTAKQIDELLGTGPAAVFDFRYGVKPEGNVPLVQDSRGELGGRNVLFEAHSIAETATHFRQPEPVVRAMLAAAKQKLLVARTRRPRPPLDDKVVTAWNGLMISALARASQALEEPRYLEAAQSAAALVERRLYEPKPAKLKRRYRAGEAAVDGFLDDYAFLIQGLADLYEASSDVRWLTWAVELQQTQDRLFWDSQRGGYFDTASDDSALLVRSREDYDGAEPAPNSFAAMNLLRLAQITDRADWRDKAEKTFAAFARHLETTPEEMPQLAAALDFELSRPRQIVIAGKPGAADTRALLHLVHVRYLPNKILLFADGGAGQAQLIRWLPFLQAVIPKQGRATAYICENYVCKLPTADPQIVARLLDTKS